MQQIRLHGRGGQGVVTAAELIAIAAFKNGFEAQAFPSFGVERTGAPLQAFVRINKEFIRTREQVYNPDILIILDATLIPIDLLKDCDEKTVLIVNTTKKAGDLGITFGPKKQKLPLKNITAVDATKIALEVFGKNLANTTIIGALAKAVPFITIASLKKAIEEKFSEKGKEMVVKNIKAVETAYNN